MFYVLDFTDHTFVSCDTAKEVNSAIKKVSSDRLDNLEIIDCTSSLSDECRYTFSQFEKEFN